MKWERKTPPFHAFFIGKFIQEYYTTVVSESLLYETARHYWRAEMKRLTIDPDTSTIIKLGLASCTFEMIRDILLFTLGATAILSLVCESKEEN